MNKCRFKLFGMCGTWSEYSYSSQDRELLEQHAIKFLEHGYDAHIEDIKTGKVWTLKLKD